VAQLRALGAEHVCDSSSPSFDDDLAAAIGATKATIAFDAIGGGAMANRILRAMERAILSAGTAPGAYGTTVHKQVYLYGMLDRGPTELDRSYGLAWGVGGWLVSNALQKGGPATAARLRARVASELTTTFASHYTEEVSLRGMLSVENVQRYAKQATGEKFLVNPSKA
jgi:NADPH2:quinone reductase